MGTRTEKYVYCDYPDCREEKRVDSIDQREEGGWYHRNRKDYCPAHADSARPTS